MPRHVARRPDHRDMAAEVTASFGEDIARATNASPPAARRLRRARPGLAP
ncbi:MAG: hypothetical protein ABWY12_13745 [Burkholderiales bacterium]